MSTLTTILLILLWVSLIYNASAAFLTGCKTFRYRDVMVDLDADRIATQPFQPRISLVVRCDLKKTSEQIPKIQELLALNYSRYETIIILDSSRGVEAFARISDYFQMREVPIPEPLNELWYPTRAVYRSRSSLFKRLIIVDKEFHSYDDLRHTGAAVCRSDYMLFLASIDNQLTRNSLARLAVMEMRDPDRHIHIIRAAARYNCNGPFFKNFFRMMADLCNMRRLYVGGALPGVDFGQFTILEDITGQEGKDEYVPQPQMYLQRKNTIRTYFSQLAPAMIYNSFQGKVIAGMELLIVFMFWATGLHALFEPEVTGSEYFLYCILMLPLLSSIFSIFVGEILLKRTYNTKLILSLLAVSLVENIAFCIFRPWLWIISLFTRPRRKIPV